MIKKVIEGLVVDNSPYGWYIRVSDYDKQDFGDMLHNETGSLENKRVRITIEEIP